jgi:glycosyltransferase involved in cell wall biosynthesis
MHPEAAIADGLVDERHWTVRLLKPVMRRAYQNCDLIGSLGSCMNARLRLYTQKVPLVPITPWALVEPAEPLAVDSSERVLAFGEAQLGLMYSGNFGRAHDAELFVRLARLLRTNKSIRFVFSVRGNRVDELQRMVTRDDTNIGFLDFAPQERLEQRLSAADVHMVSLREGFSGTVVPSKFQGAIAAGRPILFSGDPASAVAGWIKEHRIGWVIDADNLDAVAAELALLGNEPQRMTELGMHCLSVYRRYFSEKIIIDRLDEAIRASDIGQ